MFDFFGEIDVEQPQFYLQPCTRCLTCEKPILPLKRGAIGIGLWFCHWCGAFAKIRVGQKNQVTGKVRWLERHEEGDLQVGLGSVEPQETFFEIEWTGPCYSESNDDTRYPTIISHSQPVRDDEGFSSFAAAILRFRMVEPLKEIRFNCCSMSYHELMEAFQN